MSGTATEVAPSRVAKFPSYWSSAILGKVAQEDGQGFPPRLRGVLGSKTGKIVGVSFSSGIASLSTCLLEVQLLREFRANAEMSLVHCYK